ncbi:response regulator [Hyalangium rubrum]|uniref:Response regulator n=1 Tax=Hyalangium rubrum TaxID=3103134 RepID=A0ABU5GWA9_9BACT|nr:response regulator [Hyalangium sp. s54d21]MDY7225465.1 response regulator [Hyalangium sp. s54d21]
MQVLVVDDSRVARRIISRLLRELGFSVTEAADGRQALEALRAHEGLGLALVDWNMPELDGLAFVQVLRSDPTYAGVKILMVTSETGMHKVRQALQAGVDEYVMKPFTREALLEKLALLGFSLPS